MLLMVFISGQLQGKLHVTVQGMGDDVLGEGAWQTAPAGSVPNMEAVGPDAPTMIPQMDATLLEVRRLPGAALSPLTRQG